MRLSTSRLASLVSLAVLSSSVVVASAQEAQQVPPSPTPSASTAAPVFPKPSPANFTASTPTKEVVDSFVNATWGYNPNLVWQVQGILKTDLDGISKIVVLIADKSGKQQMQQLVFYSLPDGKHIMLGDIMNFGEHPFAGARAVLQQRADGPYRGAAAKDLELVEFADFQCPHCKAAQANMEQLGVDFPKARIVFQNFPLQQHPEARPAAAYGVCVVKQGGSSAFFTYASAVFDGQDGLNSADGATLTLNAAVVKAGLDPTKISACAADPATLASVDASVQLAKDLTVSETPTLFVNGRPVPANIPYETLKQLIAFQAKLDGIQ